MNKKAKAKEIGFVGYFIICVFFIFGGGLMIQNNTSANTDVSSIGTLFLIIGIVGIILGIVMGVLILLKKYKEY